MAQTYDTGMLSISNGYTLNLKVPYGITLLSAACRFQGKSTFRLIEGYTPIVNHPGYWYPVETSGSSSASFRRSGFSATGTFPALPAGKTFVSCSGNIRACITPINSNYDTGFFLYGPNGFYKMFYGGPYGQTNCSPTYSISGSPGTSATFTIDPTYGGSDRYQVFTPSFGGTLTTNYKTPGVWHPPYTTGGDYYSYTDETPTGTCTMKIGGVTVASSNGPGNGKWCPYIGFSGLVAGATNQLSVSIGGSGTAGFELYYTFRSNRAFIFPIDNVFGNQAIATDNYGVSGAGAYAAGTRVLIFADENDPSMQFAFKPINPTVGTRAILIPVGGDRYQVIAIKSATQV